MKQTILTLAVILTALTSCTTSRDQQLKSDIRQLLNEVEQRDDIDHYAGADYIERLYGYVNK